MIGMREAVNQAAASWARWRADDVVDSVMVVVTLGVMTAILVSALHPSQADEVRHSAPALFMALILLSQSAVFFLPTFSGTRQLARRLFLILSGTALVTAALGVSVQVTAGMGLRPPDPSVAPLPRLFLLVAAIAGMLWSAQALVEPVKRSIRRRWWNMGAGDGAEPPGWEGILDMLCDDASDPMRLEAGAAYPDGRGEIRIEVSIATLGAFASVVALGILFGIALDYILYPRLPDLFDEDKGFSKLANLSANLTAFLALIAAAISIVFTYQQLRAKVRADSRQAWVTKVRTLIADVLENIHDVSRRGRSSPHFMRFNKSRTLLELHLNPAEADHRLLMLLIRACVFPGKVIDNDHETAQRLADAMESWTDKKPEREKNKSRVLLSNILNICLDAASGTASRRRLLPSKERDRIVSFMFKLSHAILKREWERVRHTR